MDNNKRLTLKVEVPRKRQELKDVFIDAGINGLREAALALGRALSPNDDNRPTHELTINVPKINVSSSSDEDSDTAADAVSQEVFDEDEECS